MFNNGHHKRDFTYVEDIAEGVVRATDHVASPNRTGTVRAPDPASSSAPFRLYNIGSNRPVDLLRYIEVLEECLGARRSKNLLPLQPGDVPDTWADVDDLVEDVGYRPATPIEVGVRQFRRLVPRVLRIPALTERVMAATSSDAPACRCRCST